MELEGELYAAAGRNDVPALLRLLEQGVDLRWCNPRKGGATALHLAAARGQSDAVRVLLAAGAGVNAGSTDGRTPLYIAAGSGHVGTMRVLLGAGADVRARTKDGWTALHQAAWHGHIEAVRLLLAEGSDVKALGKDGRTPLYRAAGNGHVSCVQALLQAGADVAAKHKDGWTPLHCAAKNAQLYTVLVLLEAGASMGVQSQCGKTPLHSAAWYGHVDITLALLEAGADAGVQDKEGHTPLASSFLAMGVKDVQQRAAKAAAINAAVLAVADRGNNSELLLQRHGAGASTSRGPARAPAHSNLGATYNGKMIALPTTLVSLQGLRGANSLVKAGFQAVVQVVGGVITCNPFALFAVPLHLLLEVRAALQHGSYCQWRIQRVVERVAAMEPALRQLGTELKSTRHARASPSMVQSLCNTMLMLAQVLLALKALGQTLQCKGPGLLKRTMELLRAGGYREELDVLECELRDCLAQLSAVLSMAHFTQVSEALRGMQELQVASWSEQNEADRRRDLQRLEGQVVQAVGGVQALQQQLAHQRLVLDGQVVGLKQVADWLQQMHASNGAILQHLGNLDARLKVVHQDVHVVKDQMARLVEMFTGRHRLKRGPMDSLPDLALQRERIKVADLEGALADAKRGAFGGVVQAVWGQHRVALKVYNYTGLSRGDCKLAVNEAVLLSKANHPNIVRCYGVVYDPDTPADDSIQGSLVLEWVGGGSLSDWLQDELQEELALKGRLLLALSVAEGMQHLHEKALVHGDLKPQNVLMCSAKAATGDIVPQLKICDFNLSIYTSSSMQPTRHLTKAYTLAYTSPERTRTFEPSRADDVYAFGILLYFIATASTPFSNIRQEHLERAIQTNNRPKIDQWLAAHPFEGAEREVAHRYCELAKQCWAADAQERPSFLDVHSRLSSMLQSLGV